MANSTNFVISFSSKTGQTYRVERTETLNPAVWVPVANNIPGTGNPVQVPDTGIPLHAQRFYRVLILPP